MVELDLGDVIDEGHGDGRLGTNGTAPGEPDALAWTIMVKQFRQRGRRGPARGRRTQLPDPGPVEAAAIGAGGIAAHAAVDLTKFADSTNLYRVTYRIRRKAAKSIQVDHPNAVRRIKRFFHRIDSAS
ncbi:MAG: hypothetical protein ACRYGL_01180 [Janthinobacterium lividum]